MAGLIGLTASDIDIQDALGIGRWEYEGEWIPHPVVRLTTTMPVGVKKEDGSDAIVRARWGFDVGAGRPIGNARDDRLTESRLWASMLGRSHCLVVTTGVYEMVKRPEKQSLWFRRRDGKPIVMPGLCGMRGAKGEQRLCAAIVTTEPNRFFGQFHDRQVCALEGADLKKWLDAPEPAKAMKLLRAPPDDAWEAVPVDGKIFKHGRVETEDLVATGTPWRWKPA